MGMIQIIVAVFLGCWFSVLSFVWLIWFFGSRPIPDPNRKRWLGLKL